jgi:hypothetical protein
MPICTMRLPPSVESARGFVASVALANVADHAQAKAATVRVIPPCAASAPGRAQG